MCARPGRVAPVRDPRIEGSEAGLRRREPVEQEGGRTERRDSQNGKQQACAAAAAISRPAEQKQNVGEGSYDGKQKQGASELCVLKGVGGAEVGDEGFLLCVTDGAAGAKGKMLAFAIVS